MTMQDGKMVEPTGEDVTDSMEGQRTRGELHETTETKWKIEQYIGVRKHRARRKHTKKTQMIGDIPGAMGKEEAKKICSQMNRVRELIDEEHETRKCENCEN